LGCSDKAIPAYTDGDITAVHKNLNINFQAYYKFNNLLLGVMLGAGVTPIDGMAVAGVLDTLRANCCAAADCFSICNKLVVPGIGSTLAVISSVVNASVNLAIASPLLLPYFQGKIGTHGDFTTDMTKFNLLFTHLVEFFGLALGCSDGTIGNYTGQTLKDAHFGMNVSLAAFDAFNAAIMSVIATAIPTTNPDYNTIYGVLNGTKSDVCTAPDCGGSSTSTTGGTTTTTTTAKTTTTTTGGTTTTTSGGTTTTTSGGTTPAPATSSTGFGLVLVAPIFSLLSVFLF